MGLKPSVFFLFSIISVAVEFSSKFKGSIFQKNKNITSKYFPYILRKKIFKKNYKKKGT